MLLAPVCAAVVLAPARADARLTRIARSPYVGAIVVDAGSGRVLFEDRADRPAYPASVVKLMTFLLVLERIDAGAIAIDDPVRVTREAARMGGSQVYLAENEVFPVDDLLYALMIQSANDAAVALAIHVAGSKQAFVDLMNVRARSLGMHATQFASPHGLPPGRGQQPDVTTARDVATLSRAVLRHPLALRYTSARRHTLRGGKFVMDTHNKLLATFPGCDGLKTGYYHAAGFSLSATAARDGARVIAVVLGSDSPRTRDAKAAELLRIGLEQAEPLQPISSEAGGPFLDVRRSGR